MTAPRLMTVSETATYLSVGVQTLRNRGDLVPGRRKLGRKVVFDRVVIDQWLDDADGVRDLWVDAERISGNL